ncbi:MAG: DUF6089 family protein [Bacteroidales bacterium]|nr:DUF6089 family protein [Bacteroidales bacterium]
MKKTALTLLIVLIFASTGYSQRTEVGVMGGGSFYMGDINPNIPFAMTRPAGGLLIRYNLDTRWAIKFSALRGKIQSDDNVIKFNEDRGLSFESVINDFSLQMELNFLDYFTGSQLNSYFSPYIFGGVGVFTFNPRAEYNGEMYDLQPLRTEGQESEYPGRESYSLTQISFPFGIGVKYSLSDKICVGMEWGMRKTLTDYIDDVSQTYYIEEENLGTFNGNDARPYLSDPKQEHTRGMFRGDPQTDDWYSFAGVFITYKLNLGQDDACEYLEQMK